MSGQQIEAMPYNIVVVVLVRDGYDELIGGSLRFERLKRIQNDVETFGRTITFWVGQRAAHIVAIENRTPSI